MNCLSKSLAIGVGIVVASMSSAASAEVITDVLTDIVIAPFGPFDLYIGDGNNDIKVYFDLQSYNPGWETCWFYGSDLIYSDADIALATGVTDINQIVDASVYSLTSGPIGDVYDSDTSPDGVGDFVVHQSVLNGYWCVIQLNDVRAEFIGGEWNYFADITWWFQTDGSANFSEVPAPAALSLLALGGLAGSRRRRG